MLKYCLVSVLFLGLVNKGHGQDFRPSQHLSVGPHYTVNIQHYSLKQGLPNRGVLDIEQDKQGFIWIATFDNAYRFDGYEFKGLPKSPARSKTKLIPAVETIRTDSAGNLWFVKVQSEKERDMQLTVLNPTKSMPENVKGIKRESLNWLKFYKRSTGIHQPSMPLVIPTREGELWCHIKDSQFKKIFAPDSPSRCLGLIASPAGTLLISLFNEKAFHTDLVELTLKGQKLRQYQLSGWTIPIGFGKGGKLYLQRLLNKKIVDVAGNSATKAAQLQSIFVELPQVEQKDHNLTYLERKDVQDVNSELYYETKLFYDPYHDLFWYLDNTNILLAWHPTRGIVFDLSTTGFPIGSLLGIKNLFIDRTGVVWVSTQNGFLMITMKPNRFQRLLALPDNNSSAIRIGTRGIVRIGQKLYINSSTLRIIDLRNGQELPLTDSLRAIRGTNGSIQGHDGNFWTVYRKLHKVDPVALTTEQYPLYTDNRGWTLWQDGRHNFWIGCEQGLSVFNWQKKQNTPFTAYHQYAELAHNRVNGFFPDKQAGGIWVASSSGLYLLDTLRGIVGRYSTNDKPPYYLPFDHITFVHPDPSLPGLYWLATRGGGLIRWNRLTGTSHQFSKGSGFPNNSLYAIYEDKRQRLWLPSDYGLICFWKQTNQIRNYLPEDGIAHEEFNLTSHFRATDGRLYLGGLNGITTFMPDHIGSDKSRLFPLQIRQYQVLDSKTGDMTDQLDAIRHQQEIILKPHMRSFVIGFAIPDFQYINESRLWYRITDWQPKWTIEPGLSLKVSDLPAGSYQLEVRIQNTNGQWLSNTLSIPITVQKPFYQQYWFIILCISLLITFIGILFRWRNQQLIKEKIRLEAEVARRTAQIEQDKATIEQQAADISYHATLKARFFTNVTHEFRTPLTLLLGPLLYLQKRLNESDIQQMLARMERNAQHLLELVNNLLDLSKVDAQEMQLTQYPTDLSALLARTVAMFQSQASFSGITLQFSEQDTPKWVLADGNKIETVLKNLVANAIRFTSAGGNVTIEMTQANSYLTISVRDTGPGIHPDDLPHIFERYYQSRRPDAPLLGGTGIGLALAQDYCKLWNGTLTVESQLGVGSVFSFTYPLQVAEPPLTKVNTAPTANEHAINGHNFELKTIEETSDMRVMIVEDHYDMATYLETLLNPFYTLHLFQNGQLAWQWLTTQPKEALPHLIVSDLMMPQMDGITLLTEIRQSAHLRYIPIVILTGRSHADTRLQMLRLGAADYIVKPFDETELLTRIDNLLERAREQTHWLSKPGEDTVHQSADALAEEAWLKEVDQLILNNLTNHYFQVDHIVEHTNYSKRQLYRRIKELTGLAPNQYVQEIRMKKAYDLLETQRYRTVKEVSYAVGFQHVPYFSQLFQQRFGIKPSTLFTRSKSG